MKKTIFATSWSSHRWLICLKQHANDFWVMKQLVLVMKQFVLEMTENKLLAKYCWPTMKHHAAKIWNCKKNQNFILLVFVTFRCNELGGLIHANFAKIRSAMLRQGWVANDLLKSDRLSNQAMYPASDCKSVSQSTFFSIKRSKFEIVYSLNHLDPPGRKTVKS